MPFYRTKPVTIEARLATGAPENNGALIDWMRGSKTPGCMDVHPVYGDRLSIHTLEGAMWVSPGDYVIKGLAGEFYPCKPTVFEAKYEEIK